LGLVSFVVEKKTKEIAVRKAFGASVTNILTLISKEFITLLLIAYVIALPVAYFAVDKWLQNFAYLIHVSLWAFAMAAAITFLASFLTIIYHMIKGATANPVDSLRYE